MNPTSRQVVAKLAEDDDADIRDLFTKDYHPLALLTTQSVRAALRPMRELGYSITSVYRRSTDGSLNLTLKPVSGAASKGDARRAIHAALEALVFGSDLRRGVSICVWSSLYDPAGRFYVTFNRQDEDESSWISVE